MSTTTQILFNSPALHSLKRDQLVKLCKIHSIKASGKNVELIERLKQHARTLPPDDPLNVATRNEDEAPDDKTNDSQNEDRDPDWKFTMPRPSEQWEVVMDSIQEESSSQGTMSSTRTVSGIGPTGEFGTGGSKSTSVSSSIKALATSLGLKRNTSSKYNLGTSVSHSSIPPSHSASSAFSFSSATADELAQHAIPYSALPPTKPGSLPQMDHFTLSTPDTSLVMQHAPNHADADATFSAPIPGQQHLPGKPAPANARLSSGGGTTIRLVSASYVPKQPATPQLRPFPTSFDLIAGTPAGDRVSVWPASPTDGQRLYPTIPVFNAPEPARGGGTLEDDGDDVDMPGALSPHHITPLPQAHASPTASTQPIDIFSPRVALAPESSNAETNSTSRLSPLPRSQPFLFGSPLPQNNLSNMQFRSAAASVLEEMNRRLADAGVAAVDTTVLDRTKGAPAPVDSANRRNQPVERFNKAHEDAFKKMDSIATHYAARRDKKRKSSVLGEGGKRAPAGKRKSSAAGARVISSGVRRRMVPGGFGDEEEEEEEAEGERRLSKRPRVEDTAAGASEKGKGKKVSIATASTPNPEEDKDDVKSEKEKEERKKQKEREAIRRKLDMNKARRRSSMGRVSVGGGKAPLVPNQKAKGTTSRFGFLSSAKSIVQNVWNRGAKSTGSSIPVPKPPAPKPRADNTKASKQAPTRPSTAAGVTGRVPSGGSTSNRLLKPSAAARDNGTLKSNATTTTSRSRSPIPSFGPSTSRSSTNSSGPGSAVGTGNMRFGTTSSGTSASSMGAKSNIAKGSNVSSLGTRSSFASGMKRTTSSITSLGDKNGGIGVRKRTSSTLMAPTASSLAKTQSLSRLSLLTVPQDHNSSKLSGLSAVAEDGSKPITEDGLSTSKPALDHITNNPGTPVPRSPQPKSKFSQPLTSPSSIPTPVRHQTFSALGQTKPAVPPKPAILPGRKPRISRSRVIAKLASHRAASNSQSSARPSNPSSRTRSSMGMGVKQGGKAARSSAGGGMMMSAKKRARQSEYARRHSRAAAGTAVGVVGGAGSRAMDIDAP